jgi:hypothetical protein
MIACELFLCRTFPCLNLERDGVQLVAPKHSGGGKRSGSAWWGEGPYEPGRENAYPTKNSTASVRGWVAARTAALREKNDGKRITVRTLREV